MAGFRVNIPVGADLRPFGKDMQKLGRTLDKTGKKFMSAGRSLTRGLTVPLGIIAGASAKLAVEFEDAMAKVRAISGATEAEFKELSDSALELGRTTRFTSSQVANLQLNLSKLGFNPQEINQATASILELSLATGEDLAESTTVAASTLRGFQLEASQMQRVVDVMAKSFSSSALDLSKFSTAMAVVAPVANKAGVSLEETTAILGALVNRGVDAGSAGAALRNIYLDLADKGLTWADAMNQLKNASDPLSKAMELFGKRGAAVATIIANNQEEIAGLTTEFEGATGAAKDMSKIMDATAKGALARARSALEGVGLKIGAVLIPMINKLADVTVSMADAFSNLSDGTIKVIVAVGGVVGALGPLLTVTGKMLLMFRSSLTIIPRMVASLAALATPVGLAVAAFGALTFAVIKYINAKRKINPVSQDVIQKIGTERIAMNGLFEVLKRTTAGTEGRKKAIEELNSRYGAYLTNQLNEKSTLEDIAQAQKEANLQLLKNVLLKSKASDIEQTNTRFTENTAKAMSDLAKETKNAKTQASGYLKTVSGDVARNLEIGIIDIIGKLKDVSSQEAYNESIKDIRRESHKLAESMGIAITRTRQFDNAILGIVNAETNRNNSLIKVNTEYDKMATLLGVNIDLAGKLNEETEDIVTPGGGDAGTTQTKKPFVPLSVLPMGDDEIEELRKLQKQAKGTKADLIRVARAMGEIGGEYPEAKAATVGMAYSLEYLGKAAGQALDGVVQTTQSFGERMTDALNQASTMLSDFVGTVVVDFFQTLGAAAAGSENAFANFGDNILKNIADFLGQFGKLLVAGAIASEAFQKTLFTQPLVALAAGAALLAISGAIRSRFNNQSASAAITSGASPSASVTPRTSTIASTGLSSTAEDQLVLETVLYGRNQVLSTTRASGSATRTRRPR